MMILFTRHECRREERIEERKTLTFISRTRILDHRILRSEVFLRFLVNEPWHTYIKDHHTAEIINIESLCLKIQNERKEISNSFVTKEIRWLISPISCCSSLAFCDTLLGWWMNGKFSFLTKVAFKVVCKGVWCLYNRQNSTWLLVDIGLLFSISYERAHWTRDISSWSLEEKLHWYNIAHGVNSILSIQLWQSVTYTSLRRKDYLWSWVFCTKRERAEFKSQN